MCQILFKAGKSAGTLVSPSHALRKTQEGGSLKEKLIIITGLIEGAGGKTSIFKVPSLNLGNTTHFQKYFQIKEPILHHNSPM